MSKAAVKMGDKEQGIKYLEDAQVTAGVFNLYSGSRVAGECTAQVEIAAW